jgi:DNA-binding GntR family transcriptional regulator
VPKTVSIRSRKANAGVEVVVERLARDIQSGTIAPGRWLKQIELERRYKATRITVRRALDRLTQSRMVAHVPNRGYHAHEPDGRFAQEIQEIRLMLELAAAEKIVANATTGNVRKLRAIALKFDALSAGGSLIELYETNLRFHAELIALAANDELSALVTSLRNRLSSAPASQWQTRERILQSSREHFAIVDAVEKRRTQDLRAAIRAHIMRSGGPKRIRKTRA